MRKYLVVFILACLVSAYLTETAPKEYRELKPEETQEDGVLILIEIK